MTFDQILKQVRNNKIKKVELNPPILDKEILNIEKAKKLAKALKSNTSVTSVDLYNCGITLKNDELSEVLKTNTSITSLSFKNNHIENSGLEKLSEALKVNTFLRTINLSDNRIGVNGAKYLSEALKNNSSLTEIDLSDNNICTAGAKHLLEALQTNTTLLKLEINFNRVRQEILAKIDGILSQRNKVTSEDESSSSSEDESSSSSEDESRPFKRPRTSPIVPIERAQKRRKLVVAKPQPLIPVVSDDIIIPERLKCPLTLDIFQDPVVAEDGHTYERAAISEHFKTSNKSPLTNQKISNKLITNWDKRNELDEFLAKNPQTSKNNKTSSKVKLSKPFQMLEKPRWVEDLTLEYASNKKKSSGLTHSSVKISDDCHKEMMATVQKEGKKGNFACVRLGFVYKIYHEDTSYKPYKFNQYIITGEQDVKSYNKRPKYVHVNNVYADKKQFLDDLVESHPELKDKIKEDYEKYKKNGTGFFALKYHHSERALFKHLEDKKTINFYVKKLVADIFNRPEFNKRKEISGNVKMIAIILDVNSTRYICRNCLPAMHHFQSRESAFFQNMQEVLVEHGFSLIKRNALNSSSNNNLSIFTRYSAQEPADRQHREKKMQRDTGGNGIFANIKDLRNERKSVIFARDNIQAQIDPDEEHMLGVSNKNSLT